MWIEGREDGRVCQGERGDEVRGEDLCLWGEVGSEDEGGRAGGSEAGEERFRHSRYFAASVFFERHETDPSQ